MHTNNICYYYFLSIFWSVYTYLHGRSSVIACASRAYYEFHIFIVAQMAGGDR